MDTQVLGIWVGALFTLFIMSFLYKDNPLYKFAEHVFVGISAGYGVALQFHNVILPNLWRPLVQQNKLELLVPLVLGMLLFTGFSANFSWLSRWAIGWMIGIY